MTAFTEGVHPSFVNLAGEDARKRLDTLLGTEFDGLIAIADKVAKVVGRSGSVHVINHGCIGANNSVAHVGSSNIYIGYLSGENPRHVTDEMIARTYGLLYHELGHLLLSPKQAHIDGIAEGLDRVSPRELGHADHQGLRRLLRTLLEEGRSETLMAAHLPSTVPYLTVTSALLDQPTAQSYLRIRGKRHLPVALRDAHLRALTVPVDLVELSRIHADYLEVRYLRDGRIRFTGEPELTGEQVADKVARLLLDLRSLLPDAFAPGVTRDCESLRGDFSSSRTLADRDHVGLSPEAAQDELPAEEETPEGTEPPQDPPALAEGRTTKEILADVIEDALDDPGVAQEVSSISTELQGGRGVDPGKEIRRRPHGFRASPVTGAMHAARDELAKYLRKVRYQSEPDWERLTSSGRLVPLRAATGYDPEEWYDQWHSGDDATDLSVVLLLDGSGSMGTATDVVAQAAWVICSALESIQADCRAVVFDNNLYSLIGAGQRATGSSYDTFLPYGGTSMEIALDHAMRVIATTHRANKLVVALTDGHVSVARCNAEAMLLKQRGAEVAYGFMADAQQGLAPDANLLADHKRALAFGEVAGFMAEVVRATVEKHRR